MDGQLHRVTCTLPPQSDAAVNAAMRWATLYQGRSVVPIAMGIRMAHGLWRSLEDWVSCIMVYHASAWRCFYYGHVRKRMSSALSSALYALIICIVLYSLVHHACGEVATRQEGTRGSPDAAYLEGNDE